MPRPAAAGVQVIALPEITDPVDEQVADVFPVERSASDGRSVRPQLPGCLPECGSSTSPGTRRDQQGVHARARQLQLVGVMRWRTIVWKTRCTWIWRAAGSTLISARSSI